MANVDATKTYAVSGQILNDIGNAIRAKKGTSAKIDLEDAATEIASISGGGGGGITPTGNINITNTAVTDVTNYATAQVVDANLVAGNIKDGVSILGVTGSFSGSGSGSGGGGQQLPSNVIFGEFTVGAGDTASKVVTHGGSTAPLMVIAVRKNISVGSGDKVTFGAIAGQYNSLLSACGMFNTYDSKPQANSTFPVITEISSTTFTMTARASYPLQQGDYIFIAIFSES